ncbi:ubiquinone biosynthesis protein UbiJ [Alteromonadaceae bacterium Bs31]|nr:ubiquinone biosynthesis protein UbiJ [Alteromonadaceae bacterium Bs31]
MFTDPSLASALALSLESAINTALKFDPGTRAKLKQVEDKTLAIKCEQPTFNLFISANQQRISVSAHQDGEATTALNGSFINLSGLLINNAPSLAESGVRVEGQVALLAEYQQIVKDLDIDWEDALSSLVGDLPAHQIARLGKNGLAWLLPRGKLLPSFIAEFLTEELQALPHRTEVESFSREVEELRQKTERLDARIKLLQSQQLQQLKPSS